MKAKYIGKYKHKYDDGFDLLYKYKGYEYMISDNHNGYTKTLREQHEEEQKRIDYIINNKDREAKNEPFDFNKIWEMLDWD